MKGKQVSLIVTVTLISLGSGVWAGQRLSSGQARRLIARLGGISLPADDIHIRRMDIGFGGKDAVVEALVQTGFKLTREDDQWSVTHVRTGDRQWESVELVTTAVLAEKIKRTRADLHRVARALAAYHQDYETYPQTEDFANLIDTLVPRYLNQIIREDYWHQSYVYTHTARSYQIRSLGPDGKAGTDDDIIIEEGELLLPAER